MNAAEQALIEFIPLHNRKHDIIAHAVVDSEDYQLLNEFRWCQNPNKYVVTAVTICDRRVILYMHRVVMNPPDELEIDHINNDKLDNRKANLRFASNRQNNYNKPPNQVRKYNGKYKGVSYDPRRKLWYARIKKKWIGYFDDEIGAADAYNVRARELFEEFAWLNPIPDQNQINSTAP
jgi:hypothetical protein